MPNLDYDKDYFYNKFLRYKNSNGNSLRFGFHTFGFTYNDIAKELVPGAEC